MATWRFILASLSGTEIGEIFMGRSKQVDLPLNGLPTVSMNLDLDNPMVDSILGATELDRINLLVKGYRNGTRMFVGPLTAAEESVGDAPSLSIAAAGPMWRLGSRLVGGKTLDSLGKPVPYGDGTPLAMKDSGQIAKGLIDVANADGDTGIRPGAIGASSSTYVGPWYFKKVSEAILEMGPAVLGGYDFEMAPEEPVADASGTKIATFNTYGSLGVHRENAVFEHGAGRRNMASYRRPITADGQANRVWGTPTGFPDSIETGLSTQMTQDVTSQNVRGVFEDVLGVDLQPNDLRLKLTQEHVRIRKRPREQILFTAVPNAQPDYGEYLVGDTVPARAVVNGRLRFDANFRIFGVKFSIDDTGSESIELTLANDSA